MNARPYLLLSGTIFLIVACVHLARLFMGFDVTIAGHTAPHWASYPGLIIPGLLSFWAFRLAARARPGS